MVTNVIGLATKYTNSKEYYEQQQLDGLVLRILRFNCMHSGLTYMW